MRKVYCDLCGQQILDGCGVMYYFSHNLDFCKNCYENNPKDVKIIILQHKHMVINNLLKVRETTDNKESSPDEK